MGARRLIDGGLRIGDSSAQRPGAETPDRHLPQRAGLGRVMTDYKLPKKTERHDSMSGASHRT